MKIAFPLINEEKLAADFAHSRFIGIYDDEINTVELLSVEKKGESDNSSTFFDLMKEANLMAVASPQFSFMSIRVFRENNIETYKAVSLSLDENIEMVKAKNLDLYAVAESKVGSGCARECSDCGPVCSQK